MDTIDLTAAQCRVLRDMDAGHLTIWRAVDGTDQPDRPAGTPAVWEDLAARGLIEAPAGPGAWQLTDTGAAIAGRL
jgi:hypothetical protein